MFSLSHSLTVCLSPHTRRRRRRLGCPPAPSGHPPSQFGQGSRCRPEEGRLVCVLVLNPVLYSPAQPPQINSSFTISLTHGNSTGTLAWMLLTEFKIPMYFPSLPPISFNLDILAPLTTTITNTTGTISHTYIQPRSKLLKRNGRTNGRTQ